ncbi:MAG: adenylate kinase [Christensenellales bacterium]|jgi:adenylate kinase
MNIIFLGAPGAGKGTMASRLTKNLNIPHISTGDIFRANIKNNTELGKKAKSYIDKGLLVPDGVVIDIVADRLKRDDCANGYILDGFPRTIPQADALAAISKIDMVINLVVSDELIINRLAGRRVCGCGNTSHIEWLKGSDICPVCGMVMYQRADDKEETVRKRLKVYYDETAPLIDYYREKGVIKDIDGSGGVDAVMERIHKVVG